MRDGHVVAIALAAALAAAPAIAADAAGPAVRIAFLASGGQVANGTVVEAFRAGLRDLGWEEGANVVVDYRFAEGRYDRLPGLASQIVARKPALIVASTTPAAVAAKNATRDIPIVMATAGNPVGLGLVASLAHPGGNVTGTTYSFGYEIFAKQLQLLKEAVPAARRVAVLSNPGNPGNRLALNDVKEAAQALGLAVQLLEASGPEQFDAAFDAMARERADAVLVLSDPLFGTHAQRLAALTTKHRLPSMHGARSPVEAGGLMLYGPNIPQTVRQAAVYVDRILKGAKPSELPVEQPTKFDLVINLNTAKALGLTIPGSLLMRADQRIE